MTNEQYNDLREHHQEMKRRAAEGDEFALAMLPAIEKNLYEAFCTMDFDQDEEEY